MGLQPIPPPPRSRPPTSEEFHLGRAREAYLNDRIDLDKYERCVEVVLAGGDLPQDVRRAIGPPNDPSIRTTA